MRVLMRLAADRFLALVLVLLLHAVVLSQFSVRTTVAAARVDRTYVRETELKGSLARYRLLLEHDDTVRDSLVQSEKLEIKTNTDHAGENPVKKVDELQAGFEHHGREDGMENSREDEPNADESETAAENGEHLTAHPEEQEVEGEQQKEVQTERTESESETNAKNLQQRKIREEPQSNDEIPDHDDLEKESGAKGNEQQTKEKEEVGVQSEVNYSTDSKESESKPEERITHEVREEKSESKTAGTKPAEEEPFVFPEPYLLGPTIKDWDEQRENWLTANPHMKANPDGEPRVLIVTGSQPNPCYSPIGDHFNLKSVKLKIDYARMHNYEIYYNLVWLDPLFGGFWVKLPTVRKLMLTHPEIEWFFWIDSDAVFTDMLFEAPFHTYDSEGKNMIMWGYSEGLYAEKSWVAFNAGVFIIRNCQWSLDLIDKWSPMGPDNLRAEYGKMLTSYLSKRPENYPADDQSALAYLLLTDEAVKAKVKLVDLSDYMVSAWWVEVVDTYETLMEKYHPGLGDPRWPWITHFTGCGPCNADDSNPNYQKCTKNIERALNFADNQVLAYMGFQHESLSSQSLIRTRNESDRPLDFVGVNPWEQRIAQVAAAAV